MKIPLGGGSSTAIAAGQTYPRAIAVDSNSVYWVNSGLNGTIMKVSK